MYNIESFYVPSAGEAGLNSFTISKVAGKKIWRRSALLALSVVALSTGSTRVLAQSAAPAATPAKASTKPAAKKTTATTDAAASALPVKSIGNKAAPITMEVFSDYKCPACGSFFEQTLRPMLGPDGYVAAGKVYFVHRDFPLPMHAYSHQAARWVNAAAKIGKFQDVDAVLFDNQAAWGADGNIEKYIAQALSPTDLKRVQKLMTGCEPTSTSCSLDAYISSDQELGKSVPVQSTPTFVVFYKGQKYPASSGVVTYPILKQFFDSLLSQ
jgi:protein-disulfide isomerase